MPWGQGNGGQEQDAPGTHGQDARATGDMAPRVGPVDPPYGFMAGCRVGPGDPPYGFTAGRCVGPGDHRRCLCGAGIGV